MTSRWDEMMDLKIPNEKGALLYQRPGRRWVWILELLILAVGFFVVAVLFALPVLWFWDDPDVGWPMRIVLLTMAGMFAYIGAWVAVGSVRTMPFRVYEGGVTDTYVPFRDGLAGREAFVPASKIEKVTWESRYLPKVGVSYYYLFHRIDGDDFSTSVKEPEEMTPLLRQVLPCPVEGPE